MQPKIIKVSDFSDKQLFCVDCGCEFTWSSPEQASSKAKDLTPRRSAANHAAIFRRLSLVLDDRPSAGQAVHQDGGKNG